MADSKSPKTAESAQAPPPTPPAGGGPPPFDPLAIIRSTQYIRLLVLAALLGVPLSAIAYGFLALVMWIQRAVFTCPFKHRQPERLSISTFRWRLVYGPEDDKVCALTFCLHHAVDGVCGHSNEMTGTDDIANGRHRQTRFSQMHAVGVHRRRKINAIIDEDGHPCGTCETLHILKQCHELAGIQVTLAHLYGCPACINEACQYGKERTALRLMPVRHQVEAEIDGRHPEEEVLSYELGVLSVERLTNSIGSWHIKSI